MNEASALSNFGV